MPSCLPLDWPTRVSLTLATKLNIVRTCLLSRGLLLHPTLLHPVQDSTSRRTSLKTRSSLLLLRLTSRAIVGTALSRCLWSPLRLQFSAFGKPISTSPLTQLLLTIPETQRVTTRITLRPPGLVPIQS